MSEEKSVCSPETSSPYSPSPSPIPAVTPSPAGTANPFSYQPYPTPSPKKGWILGLIALIISVLSLVAALFFGLMYWYKDDVALMVEPEFHIDNFTIEKEVTEYDYIEDTVRYTGEGQILTPDKTHVYEVVLEETLVSGGDEKSGTVTHSTVLVIDGTGSFYTYDYGDEGDIDKPVYTFKVIAYKVYQTAPVTDSETGGTHL